MEEVTESYVLLSSLTYPQGGFNLHFSEYQRLTLGVRTQFSSQAPRWHIFPQKICPKKQLIKSFCHRPCMNTSLTRPDRWNQIAALPAGGKIPLIYPILSDYHMRSERQENVIDLRAAAQSAREGQRGRKKKRTERSAFMVLCFSTLQRARLGLSLSVSIPQFC